MKKKTLVILGSAFAAAALVGGTFAAYAVTDNAAPFSVKITPGTLDVGDTKSVTLTWGTKGLLNVENLKLGEEKGPFELGLVATTNDNTAFEGNLSVELSTTATGEVKLIDHLTVSVWEEQAKTNKVLEIKGDTTGHKASKDIIVASGTEKKVYFFVSIDSDVTPLQFEAMSEDIVNMTLDWNKGTHVEEAESLTYYFDNAGGWANVYAYAWNNTTKEQAKAWPGVKMEQAKGHIYSVALDTTYDSVVFNNGLEGESNVKTDDLTLNPAKRYYKNNEWIDAPSAEDLAGDVEYYLVGTMNEWKFNEDYKLAADTSKTGYTYSIKNVQVAAGAELKVVSSENDWYGESSKAADAPNMSIGQAGKYNFFFNPEAATTFIFCEPAGGVDPEPTAGFVNGKVYVVGSADLHTGTATGEGAWGEDVEKAFLCEDAERSAQDIADGMTAQYHAKITFAKDDEFKLLIGDNTQTGGVRWFDKGIYEAAGGLDPTTGTLSWNGDNIKVGAAGAYDIYVKCYSDFWSIWVSAKAAA